MTDPTFEALSKLKNKTFYGWYSEEQSKYTGSVIYENEQGHEIEVTDVRTTTNKPFWEDSVYVGKVTRFVRTAAHNRLR